MLGPFWRMHSPLTENGGSIVRSPTPGPPLVVTATGVTLRGERGILADVAPTVLDLLGISQPPAMTGRTLLAHDGAPR